ncbi:transmembrane protein 145-like [Ptychodera flava]|uniref:transmembrane protein 145-like n=1 Tax=Ptychodera flava TaxID=63121 RepID=UPI00396A9ED1
MKSTQFTSVGFLGLILVQLLMMSAVEAKFIHGHLTTASNFQFLDRFCFQPNEKGTLHYEIKYKADQCCYKLLMFNDEPGQWQYIRKHEDTMTCGEKKEVIPGSYNNKLTLEDGFNGCEKSTDADSIEWIRCVGGRSFQTDRTRWWYLVISNCYSDNGIEFEYNITMTNGVKLWDKHFSADERYILETNMIFFFVYFAMFGVTMHFTKVLKERKLLHCTYKLFVWSILAELSSLLLLTVALGSYGSTGVPLPGLQMFANLLGAAGNLVFILMIILLGKGFTVTRGTLSELSWIKLAIFMTLYSITYFALYIYEETMFDPRDVLYKYESVAGYGLVGPFFIGFLWTCYAIFTSIKDYPDKVSFYVPFGVIFALWWLATPVTIFICNHAIETWVRAKIVNCIERAVICGGHVFFLLLTRPNAANKNFPFHIKTTQIAALDDDDDGNDTHRYGDINDFVMRAESGNVVGLDFTDLFMTDHDTVPAYAVPAEKVPAEKVPAQILLADKVPACKQTVIQIEPRPRPIINSWMQ